MHRGFLSRFTASELFTLANKRWAVAAVIIILALAVVGLVSLAFLF